jgi:asparagine synthase (glutamine-hydrolysing)
LPGISLFFDANKNLKREEILKTLKEFPLKNYKVDLIFQDDSFLVFSIFYNFYPFKIFKNNNFLIFFEGKIYNKADKEIEERLKEIYEDFLKDSKYKDKIRNFISETDGEYIIGIFDKNKFLIFNDPLGRLPLYYFKNEENFFLSRDIGVLNKIIQKKEIDLEGILEYLIFMYPIDNKTLIKNVQRSFPGEIFEFKNGKIKIYKIFEWNFEEKQNISYKKSLEILYENFIEGLKNRVENFKDFNLILGLSGGFDSRIVFLGLKKLNFNFYPVTFVDPDKKHLKDLFVSKKIAEISKMNLRIFDIKEFKLESIKELIEIKGGLNYAEMGFLIDFLKEAKKTYGEKSIYFTGDGGDKILPYILPEKRFKDYEELLKWIIIKNKIFGLDEIQKISNLNIKKIKENILEKIYLYPEKNLNYKYIHFLFYERCFNWLFEGEDRNRYFMFSTTPFYALELFKNGIFIPDKYKKYYKIYRDFFKILDGEIAKIEKSFFGFNIFSKKMLLREFLKYNFSKFLFVTQIIEKNKEKIYTPPFPLKEKFIELMKRNEILKEIFNFKNLEKIPLTKNKFFTLLTLLLFFENF